MISRLVLSIGAVAASVGLLLVGMATSYSPEDGGMRDLGLAFMIGGAIAVAIGIAWYRKTEQAQESDAVTKFGPNRG
jgi:drug/metabolite transporter (DMT)-like permease